MFNYEELITNYLERHPEMIKYINVDNKKIATAIVTELINNSTWNEDAYPGLKERILESIHKGD